MNQLNRLLKPRSIAVIGGGIWCENAVKQCLKIGFSGNIWPIHPNRKTMGGLSCYHSIEDLPAAPDASFIGVNRFETVKVLRRLNAKGAGGAVCFASGFREALSEDAQGADLENELLKAAGDMTLLGPNCYGFVNYLDNALLWPDQHGGIHVDNGVAIITQSSNIAINLTMQTRGLPIAFIATVGNQAQIDLADLGLTLLNDPRISALGLHIEGINNLKAFEHLAHRARQIGKPIIVLKVGVSHLAQEATISHTASLAGSDSGARALFARLGICQVKNLSSMLESLKLAHVAGYLPSKNIISLSCSGGEASLIADLAQARGLRFPPLTDPQKNALRASLGNMVKLANPLDYHTYIWGNTKAMYDTFKAALSNNTQAIGLCILDFPRDNRCDPQMWKDIIPLLVKTQKNTGIPLGVVASIADTMPEKIAHTLIEQGLIPFNGMEAALDAIVALATNWQAQPPVLAPSPVQKPHILYEAEAKHALSSYKITLPKSSTAKTLDEIGILADEIGYPIVIKGENIAHKTDVHAVALNITTRKAAITAAKKMPCKSFLVEQMITDCIAELLLGVVLDRAHGYVLTIAAGGELTEIFTDRANVLLPVNDTMIKEALQSLKIWPILAGYRGKDSVHFESIFKTIYALQSYVIAHHGRLSEVEINPLICTKTNSIVADALIQIGN